MIYIFITFASFFTAVILQICIHKILRLFGRRTFVTVYIVFLGFFINAYEQYLVYQHLQSLSVTQVTWTAPLPATASFLYLLLFFFYITYSASPYLGQEGPTSKILNLFKKHQTLNEQQVISTFTDRETVDARIDDLLGSGWVKKSGEYIILNPFGRFLARFISVYRKILGLQSGG